MVIAMAGLWLNRKIFSKLPHISQNSRRQTYVQPRSLMLHCQLELLHLSTKHIMPSNFLETNYSIIAMVRIQLLKSTKAHLIDDAGSLVIYESPVIYQLASLISATP